MENVITEFRVVETEDGFRIEIKGDKEKLRPFFTGAGWNAGRGWRHGHGRSPGWGPFGFGFPPMGWMRMGPWWGQWGYEGGQGEEDQPKEA